MIISVDKELSTIDVFAESADFEKCSYAA